MLLSYEYNYYSSNFYIVYNTDISNDISNIYVINISVILIKNMIKYFKLTYRLNFNILDQSTDKIKTRLIFVFDNWLIVDIILV